MNGPGAPDIERWLTERVSTIARLDPTGLDPREPFVAFGLDSVDAVGLSGELEDWLGLSLSPMIAWDHPTIELLSAYLSQQVAAGSVSRSH